MLQTPEQFEDQVLCCLLEPELATRISSVADPAWFTVRRGMLESGLAEHRSGERVTLAGWSRRHAERERTTWESAAADIAAVLAESYGCRENLDRYLEILRVGSAERRLATAGVAISENPTTEAAQSAEAIGRELMPRRPNQSITDLLPEVIGDLTHPHVRRAALSTGLWDLDAMLDGGLPSGLNILAGRTSMGKSALAMNIATRAVLDGVPTLYVSLEMDSMSLARRCLSHVSGVPMRVDGGLNGNQSQALAAAAQALNENGHCLKFPHAGGGPWTPQWLDAELERAMPLGLVVVDYLTLMHTKGHSRYEEIAKILGSLRAAATRVGCPLLVLAQLNRAPEQRPDKRPNLADLRDSGNIEEAADTVLLIHRPGYYDRNIDPALAEVGVAKNREGRTGIVELTWRPETTSFLERRSGF